MELIAFFILLGWCVAFWALYAIFAPETKDSSVILYELASFCDIEGKKVEAFLEKKKEESKEDYDY